jgi:Uma2 family endonuclease
VDDLLAQDCLCELVDGILVEKPVGWVESRIEWYLGMVLGNFVHPANLGVLVSGSGASQLGPGLARMPDLAFTKWDRMPNGVAPQEKVCPVAPNLAVEVLSDANTAEEMRIKREEYFQAGVELVWEIDVQLRTVSVWTSLADSTILTRTDTLTGGSVLPGFSLSLADLFAELDRHG